MWKGLWCETREMLGCHWYLLENEILPSEGEYIPSMCNLVYGSFVQHTEISGIFRVNFQRHCWWHTTNNVVDAFDSHGYIQYAINKYTYMYIYKTVKIQFHPAVWPNVLTIFYYTILWPHRYKNNFSPNIMVLYIRLQYMPRTTSHHKGISFVNFFISFFSNGWWLCVNGTTIRLCRSMKDRLGYVNAR